MTRRLSLLATALVLGSCGSSGPARPAEPVAPVATPTPATPEAPPPAAAPDAAQRFEEWLAAFNSADRAKIEAFRERGLGPDVPRPPVEDIVAFSEETGGFVVVEVEETGARKHTVLIKERGSEQYARAIVEIEADAPHRISSIGVRGIATPAKYAPPRLGEADALAALTAELDRLTEAGEFSGAVAIAKDGKPIFARAYGFADREQQVANTVDTRFRIGSMNKMFTAVATLQLVQRGKLKLDDTVGKRLPGYPDQGVATKVTIHHLLSHTGGTGDIFGPDFDQHRLTLRTHADYVKLYGARALAFEPGAQWRYSNYGFLLLGAILEQATRKPYYDAVQAAVFKPAGMKSTSSPVEDQPMRGRSLGYMRESKKSPWQSNRDTLPYRGTSAGGGDSTVLDLLRFAQALRAHKLLDATHTALLTSRKPGTPDAISYGYGFSFADRGGLHCIGHGGGAPGMNGDLAICDNGYTVAVLANLDPPAAGRVADFILARLPSP